MSRPIGVVALAVAVAALAQVPTAQAGPFRGVLGLGVEFGGDDLLQLTYSDGSTSSLEAARGVSVAVGGLYHAFRTEAHRIEVQGTIALKYGTLKAASNQDASFIRYPLELLAFYGYEPFRVRIGGGLAYHLAPNISAEGSLLNADVDLDNALGGVLQADYLISPSFAVGIRYTFLEYKGTGTTATADASAVGVNLTLFLFGD